MLRLCSQHMIVTIQTNLLTEWCEVIDHEEMPERNHLEIIFIVSLLHVTIACNKFTCPVILFLFYYSLKNTSVANLKFEIR